jgi:uncharacterized protein with GYD domain
MKDPLGREAVGTRKEE